MLVTFALLNLQERDSAIAQKRRLIAEPAEARAVKAALVLIDDKTKKLNVVAEELTRAEQERNRLDGAADSLNAKIDAANTKLMGGNVTNPRELTALQDDVKMLEKQLAGLEDEELEAMVAVDELAAQKDVRDRELEELAAEHDKLTAALSSVTELLSAELAELLAGRDNDAAQIDPGLLQTYERLLEKRDGPAAAALEGGVCQSCHMSLPAEDLHKLVQEAVPRCPQCEVILVPVS